MSDLLMSTERNVIETALLRALQYALQVRLLVATDIATLRAMPSVGVTGDSLRFVTSKGVCYRFSRYATGSDDSNLVVKPSDVGLNAGRWLKTSSIIQSGYVKAVQIYQGEATVEKTLERILGVKPSLLLVWTGAEHQTQSQSPGALYWKNNHFDIWAISTNLRNSTEVLEGSGISSEFAADKGCNQLIGDAKLAVIGTQLQTTTGIDRVEPGNEAQIVADLQQRTFIQKVGITVYASVHVPDTDGVLLDTQLFNINRELVETPTGAHAIDLSNYLTSGYNVPTGTGLTKTLSAGTAVVYGNIVSSTPASHLFTASRNTYRDLRANGAFVYTEVLPGQDAPAIASGALRVGVTSTDSTGVIADKILSDNVIQLGIDTVPPTGPMIYSISVTPSSASVVAGLTQQFTATATLVNGLTKDVTYTCAWASSATSVATISATGLATTIIPGPTNIIAVQGGVTSPAAVLTAT